ncbi:Beauvericin cluster-specific repressor BEA4 [Lachnellula suecica]|uniref:Beauvericin cluster-specific repressor BEA4 n=1 Tax=Lachnellula suecica TaxID=602035 RepID=A0A8T9CER6_9HELO|nr:Beauvericin cluster-specific repressor BEA4 [Lachnellula suecica]
METITIPSPTAFLASPVLKPAPEPPPPKRKHAAPTKSATSTKKSTGIVKPKQSKSRNGCITCKAKRLKCDETKPTCQQCHKRSVTCGGYKKDFKWRPFEETTFANKAVPSPKSKRRLIHDRFYSLRESPRCTSCKSQLRCLLFNARRRGRRRCFHAGFILPRRGATPPSFPPLPDIQFDHPPMFDMSTPPYLRELPRPRFEANTVTRSLSSLFEETNSVSPNTPSRPSFSGQSPRLIDLLIPGSELNARPGSVSLPPLSMPTPTMSMSPIMDSQFLPQLETAQDSVLDGDVEEIVREPQISDADMWMSLRGQHVSRSSTASPTLARDDPFNKIYRQPEVQAGSPEMLMLRFDKQTCGILSVKDGPTENPWRTLVWPLARDSPALYHAIASMTAFHTSKERPALRVDGMEHMRRSIRSLATGIEKMRTDTALATTLVLAFSESWDQHISTGIEHLRGAKILVNQALISHKKRNLTGDDFQRLRFLCNTWVYMDVIARLTSVDDDESNDFDQVLDPLNTFSSNEIDPLMGCAQTLFPLIGRAANLCRRVRKVESNSIQIISQAIELKEAIEQWCPPPLAAFERPEDPTSEIQHALQTAEAYRYATLLYLHQAVPEIPSLTSAQLAKKVLVYLATVPLSSRLVIVQIYPLLAAGCEAYDNEDRQWVEERWQSMVSRMWIGNIDRCWEVMTEVWRRRDAKEQREKERSARRQGSGGMVHSESSKRKFEEELAMEDMFSFSDMLNANGNLGERKKARGNSLGQSFSMGGGKRRVDPVTEEMDPELTVRGSLHWVGVMKDWNWEILLG